MEHAEQVAQIKVLMSRLDSGTTVDAGGVRLNPTSSYVDPALAGLERSTFFEQHPQIIGMSGDLLEPGSFFTMNDLGFSVLATRDAEGDFHAFVNACRHRGVEVEERERGTARRFTCPFHSWTYDPKGSLVGMPKADHFGPIDADCHGLVELPSLESHGLLWVHPQTDGVIDIDQLLSPDLQAELTSWRYDRLRYLGADSYDVACNWKLAMDTFGETYHFESLHSETLANGFYGNVQCYDTYERNHRMILCRRDIDTFRQLPEDEWDVLAAGLPVYWLFPNVQLLALRFGAITVRAYPHPDDPGRHMSRIHFYIWPEHAAEQAAVDFIRDFAQGFAEVIRDEDYVASASQQRTANSGKIENVVFGRNEPALHHYHNVYRSALGMDQLPLVDAKAAATA